MTNPETIKSLKRRLANHRRNLCDLLEQRATLGTAQAPPNLHRLIEIERDEIKHCRKALRWYGLDVPAEPDDGDPSDADGLEDPIQRLHQALLKLNYHDQDEIVQSWLQDNKIGAFIIHGPTREYGQLWLLNRLIREHVPSPIPHPMMIDLIGVRGGCDAASLWRDLGRRLRAPDGADQALISRLVCQRWSTQPVVLVLNNVGRFSAELIQSLIEQFWIPLACAALAQPQPHTYHLLLFLIDTDGLVQDHIPTAADPLGPPQRPFWLQALGCISEQDLRYWFRYEGRTLLAQPNLQIIQELLKQTRGVPQETLEQLCGLCNINWYDEEHRWVIYR